MVSKEQKKLNRVINFVKKGLDSLADDLEDVVKSINDFTKSLQKAQKDLKDVTEIEEVQTISTSSKRVATAPVQAKSAAANTLFSLLSHGEGGEAVGGTAASTAPTGAVTVDITPLEERLEQLSKAMVSKSDLEPLQQELEKLRDERMKEAEDTIDNVTVLLEKGLALTELTTALKEIESHLQEIIAPPK